MTDIELSDLELPSWPVEAYPFEPVHSLFARFAERNGQTSTAVFARHVGINWTHPNLPELINFCSKYPIRHLERITAATPTPKDKRLIINDQVFNPNIDWSIYQPRVCEGCLYEVPYYRNWWDITAIYYCPIHDRPLIARRGRARLTLWYSKVGETPDGGRFANFAPRVEASAHKWEHYLLGRMGVLQTDPNPTLDTADLCHVIEAAEVLGIIAGGLTQSPNQKREKALSSRRAGVLASGAPVLLSGAGAIYECAHAYVRAKQKFLEQTGRRPTHGALFGGRLLKLAQQSDNPLLSTIRAEIDKAIDDTKVYIRRVKATHTLATRSRRIPFAQLASELGLNTHLLRQVALKLDMIPARLSHGAYMPLSSRDMDALRVVANDLVDSHKAVDCLGLSARDLDGLHKHRILAPFLRSRFRSHDRYRRQDLNSLLSSVRAVSPNVSNAEKGVSLSVYRKSAGLCSGEVLSRLLAGTLKAINWDDSRQGLRGLLLPKVIRATRFRAFRPRAISEKPGLSKAGVAAILGVTPAVTKALLTAGYLRLTKGSSTGRPRVDEQCVLEFSRKYAPAHLYAESLNCRPSSTYAALSAHGIAKLPNVNIKDASFVERNAVRAALGLDREPDDDGTDMSATFWRAFSGYVARSGDSTRMFSRPSRGRVRLYSGDRALSVIFETDFQRQTIAYELTCDSSELSRRYDRIIKRLSEVSDFLGEEAIKMEREGHVVVSETIRCKLGHQDNWPGVFAWVEQRMSYFRSIFCAKAPPELVVLNTKKTYAMTGGRIASPSAAA